MKAVLVQIDGGPDHNINFLRTRLAALGLFLSSGADIIVFIRGAPHGSAMNVAERSISLLNMALSDLALKRGRMLDWAEQKVENANSMVNAYIICINLRMVLPKYLTLDISHFCSQHLNFMYHE